MEISIECYVCIESETLFETTSSSSSGSLIPYKALRLRLQDSSCRIGDILHIFILTIYSKGL